MLCRTIGNCNDMVCFIKFLYLFKRLTPLPPTPLDSMNCPDFLDSPDSPDHSDSSDAPVSPDFSESSHSLNSPESQNRSGRMSEDVWCWLLSTKVLIDVVVANKGLCCMFISLHWVAEAVPATRLRTITSVRAGNSHQLLYVDVA